MHSLRTLTIIKKQNYYQYLFTSLTIKHFTQILVTFIQSFINKFKFLVSNLNKKKNY